MKICSATLFRVAITANNKDKDYDVFKKHFRTYTMQHAYLQLIYQSLDLFLGGPHG